MEINNFISLVKTERLAYNEINNILSKIIKY